MLGDYLKRDLLNVVENSHVPNFILPWNWADFLSTFSYRRLLTRRITLDSTIQCTKPTTIQKKSYFMPTCPHYLSYIPPPSQNFLGSLGSSVIARPFRASEISRPIRLSSLL